MDMVDGEDAVGADFLPLGIVCLDVLFLFFSSEGLPGELVCRRAMGF